MLNIYVYVNSLTYRTSFLWRKEALLGSTWFLMGLAFKASDQVLTTLYKMCISRHDQSLIKTTTQAYCTFICLVIYNWNVYSGDIDL